MSLSVPIAYFRSEIIYLKWLQFHHNFPVHERKLSEYMPHQKCPFDSSKQREDHDIDPVL